MTWSFDPAIGSPADWKKKMCQDGCWGDEIFLVLASNILKVDLIIVPAFRESAIHRGLGFTLIKSFEKPEHPPLFLFVYSESDFSTPHYQSIRPNRAENVLLSYLRENQDLIDQARTPVLQETFQETSVHSVLVVDDSR